MTEFVGWPKTPRLFRDMTVTEKIDGTNGAIHIEKISRDLNADDIRPGKIMVGDDAYIVTAQSRKRLIDPSDDNHGFAAWVRDNAESLVTVLGEGIRFGEWWGQGIQRNYGMTQKRFSLFNRHKWSDVRLHHYCPPQLDVVPAIYEGPFETAAVRHCLDVLSEHGSVAVPGFMRPEGVIIYHAAARSMFKALIENDDAPKGETNG